MANRKFEELFKEGTHKVGNINTSWAKPITNGAILTGGDLDNYTLVELAGYNADGVLQCKLLTDKTKKGLLLSTNEEESLFGDGNELLQGNYCDFYNKQGDICGLTIQEEYLRFEVSGFTKNAGVSAVKVGMVAHFDPATKAYIVSKSESTHADFTTAGNKYTVVAIDTDFGANMGLETIRLECK